MRTADIELVLAHHFDYRRNVIIPNVFWGMGLYYEADVVVLMHSDYAYEVEIKVSASDLVRDAKKRHHHDSNLFRETWFAVPEKLSTHSAIPENAGILAIIGDKESGFYVKTIKRGRVNKMAKKWTTEQKLKLMSLGILRIWTLKEKLLKLREKARMKSEPADA
jgi:hypothetical protein